MHDVTAANPVSSAMKGGSEMELVTSCLGEEKVNELCGICMG